MDQLFAGRRRAHELVELRPRHFGAPPIGAADVTRLTPGNGEEKGTLGAGMDLVHATRYRQPNTLPYVVDVRARYTEALQDQTDGRTIFLDQLL
jgi:hypothetical protein